MGETKPWWFSIASIHVTGLRHVLTCFEGWHIRLGKWLSLTGAFVVGRVPVFQSRNLLVTNRFVTLMRFGRAAKSSDLPACMSTSRRQLDRSSSRIVSWHARPRYHGFHPCCIEVFFA